MCFERTTEKVKRFNVGYRVMIRKAPDRYYPIYNWKGNRDKNPVIKGGEWIDERPYRPDDDLFIDDSSSFLFAPGWHVFSSINMARRHTKCFSSDYKKGWVILRVECYGLAKPYGLGLAYGEPSGHFQFMKILEEVA